jgi:hypothetical protein
LFFQPGAGSLYGASHRSPLVTDAGQLAHVAELLPEKPLRLLHLGGCNRRVPNAAQFLRREISRHLA